jgi:serine protease Do
VIVKEILEDGPAANAGLKVGEVVVKMDEKIVNSKANFDENLAYHRPGDEIELTILRDGKESEKNIKLINKTDNTSLMMKGAVNSKVMGADFQPLTASDLSKYGLSNGIRLLNIRRGSYVNQMGLPNGFIIVKFNNKAYSDAADLISAMESSSGRIAIEGLTKEGSRQSFTFITE